jgi:pimeloyl-ACP methyl ester carboxylesterase
MRWTVSCLTAIALLVSGCARNVSEPERDAASSTLARPLGASTAVKPATAGSVSGSIGPGSSYTISVPEIWNGDLVLYAHGYTATLFPLGPPPTESPEALRDLVQARGCAFAFSTYSQNGYVVQDAALRTLQLGQIFASKFGRPNHTYLLGYSLGGLVTIKLVEQHPDLYSGALTVSGIVGGTETEFTYLGNVWVLFQYFYPGVVRWGLFDAPPANFLSVLTDSVVVAIQANPQGAAALSQVTQAPLPFASGPELVGSIVQALVLQSIAVEDLLSRTHGHPFFDNTHTSYTGNLPPELLADLNARVARYASAPDADAWTEREYAPTGSIRIPLLTLHGSRDPVVPILHEGVLAERVGRAGDSPFLVQRTIDAYGHPVGLDEVDRALGDLKTWVTTGVAPKP